MGLVAGFRARVSVRCCGDAVCGLAVDALRGGGGACGVWSTIASRSCAVCRQDVMCGGCAVVCSVC